MRDYLRVDAKDRMKFVQIAPGRYEFVASGDGVGLACELFAEHVLSLGKAACIANMSQEVFIEQLGAIGVPAVVYSISELEQELQTLGT